MERRWVRTASGWVVMCIWTLVVGCPAGPPGGGVGDGGGGGSNGGGGGSGVPGTNVNRPVRAASEVTGFFEADEPWAVGSPTFLAFGVGDFVDFMTLTTEQAGGTTCLASTPAATIEFSEGSLRIDSQPLTDLAGVDCSIDVLIDAASCAPDEVFGPPNPCFTDGADGEILINGGSNSPDLPRIVRLQTCDAPAFLSSISEWAILSVHPFALPFIDDPADFGAIALIEGAGSGPTIASLVTGVDALDNPLGCSDGTPAGTVTILNDTLSIDLNMEGQDNDSGLGSPGMCSLRFTGSMTFCEIISPSELGGSGASIELVRFDGTGQYESQIGSGTLKTMYFSYEVGTGGGGLPGGVRVKSWVRQGLDK